MISFDEFILDACGSVYLQIIRYIKQRIASGTIGNREEIPSRRILSALLGVNPNTIQKAYGIGGGRNHFSRSGAKNYTSVSEAAVERIRRELLLGDTGVWVKAMKQLGLTRIHFYQWQ